MDDGETISWRRDASTSATIRVLWAIGTGGFLAAIGLIVFARFVALSVGEVVIDPLLAFGVSAISGSVGLILLIAATGWGFQSVGDRLPSGGPLERVVDTLAGAAVMGAVILALAGGIGGGVGQGLAAGTIPVALLSVALSSFLRSVGTLEVGEGRLFLHEPDAAVDLTTIVSVDRYDLADVSLLRLRYGQPDGQYVPGPRWLVVPPAVALEVAAFVGN